MKTKKPPTRYVYTVTGTGEFPKDMLRYDEAEPYRPEDEMVVNATYDDPIIWDEETQHMRVQHVKLVSESRFAGVGNSEQRWRSFIWRVETGPRRVL
jgi:hypothetical protein